MTEEELYDALVRLCQAYGLTNEETYAKLREAIETIVECPDDLGPAPSHRR